MTQSVSEKILLTTRHSHYPKVRILDTHKECQVDKDLVWELIRMQERKKKTGDFQHVQIMKHLYVSVLWAETTLNTIFSLLFCLMVYVCMLSTVFIKHRSTSKRLIKENPETCKFYHQEGSKVSFGVRDKIVGG